MLTDEQIQEICDRNALRNWERVLVDAAEAQTRMEIAARLSQWVRTICDEGDGEYSIGYEESVELNRIIQTLKRGESI